MVEVADQRFGDWLSNSLNYSTNSEDSSGPEFVSGARQYSYSLLSDLYFSGITSTTLPGIKTVRPLSESLPQSLEWDEAAAEHFRLFDFSLLPYESIFMESSGLLGGPTTTDLVRDYNQVDFLSGDPSIPDHIGQELAFQAFLCGAERKARADDEHSLVQESQQQQQRFMEQNLMRWLPPFVVAVKQQGNKFYAAAADLTLALASNHYLDLIAESNEATAGQFSLPEAPDLMGDEKTGLRDIARFLVMTPYSGIYFGRGDIGALARGLNLPHGFGSRGQMMQTLLQTAAQYEQFGIWCQTVRSLVTVWVDAYGQMRQAYPGIGEFVGVWERRATETAALLSKLQDDAKRVQ